MKHTIKDPSPESNMHIYRRAKQIERMVSKITFFLENHMKDDEA